MSSHEITLMIGGTEIEAEITSDPQLHRNPDQVDASARRPVIVCEGEVYDPRDRITLPQGSAIAVESIHDYPPEAKRLVEQYRRIARSEGWHQSA